MYSINLFALLIGFFAFLFGALPIYYKETIESKMKYFISLSAGVVLGASFIHIIPEAFAFGAGVFDYVFLGFLFFYGLESMVMMHACRDEDCERHSFGIIAFVGMAIHSFIDGAMLALGFLISGEVGLVILFSLLLHKFPESFCFGTIMMHSKYSAKSALKLLLLFVAAFAFGALAGQQFLGDASKNSLYSMLAFSGGGFLYIGASDLLPEVHREVKNRLLLSLVFLFGIAIQWII